MIALTWVVVPGGIYRPDGHGDPIAVPTLQWSRTPITIGHLDDQPAGNPDLPLTCITHAEATTIAADLGGRLPTSDEWGWMAGADRRRYPWGDDGWMPRLARLAPSTERPKLWPVGSCPDGATPDGVLDVAGCVWEWTSTAAPDCVGAGGYVIRGGSYTSPVADAWTTAVNTAPADLASPGIGLRVVRPQ